MLAMPPLHCNVVAYTQLVVVQYTVLLHFVKLSVIVVVVVVVVADIAEH